MSEYKKTALVLGAGGFIGSHMVKRLRAEGYWVRGVDLKYPEYSVSEANEFIRGDLRDVRFVSRCIRFTGYLGNFYQQIAEKFVQPFDEIFSLPLIWVEQDSSLLVRTMQISCTTLCQST
jgi:GDP-D-mannose 3',5'-epimerase